MTGSSLKLQRIGALDIAEAISAEIGSYVDMNFMQFLAVEGSQVRCWRDGLENLHTEIIGFSA